MKYNKNNSNKFEFVEDIMSEFSIREMLTMQQAYKRNIKISGKQFVLKQVSINCCG